MLEDKGIRSALVFTRTKHGANRLAGDLVKAGIRTEAIHGNKSQNARQLALSNFKLGRIRVLVATDIAARGLDIEELSHVVNYELPNVPETYVHRIGRTGRAGASGLAISFCDTGEERDYLRDIQKLIGMQVPVVRDHPFDGAPPPPREVEERGPRHNHQRPRQQSSHRPSGEKQQQSHGSRQGQGQSSANNNGSGNGASGAATAGVAPWSAPRRWPGAFSEGITEGLRRYIGGKLLCA